MIRFTREQVQRRNLIFRYLTIQILGESRNVCLRFIRFILRRSNGRSNTINILFNRINFPNVTGASKERERGGGGKSGISCCNSECYIFTRIKKRKKGMDANVYLPFTMVLVKMLSPKLSCTAKLSPCMYCKDAHPGNEMEEGYSVKRLFSFFMDTQRG